MSGSGGGMSSGFGGGMGNGYMSQPQQPFAKGMNFGGNGVNQRGVVPLGRAMGNMYRPQNPYGGMGQPQTGGQMMYAGGSPTFNESMGQPQTGGQGDMWHGAGSPTLDTGIKMPQTGGQMQWNEPPPTNGGGLPPDTPFTMPNPYGPGTPNRNIPPPSMTGINPYDQRHEVSWPGMGDPGGGAQGGQPDWLADSLRQAAESDARYGRAGVGGMGGSMGNMANQQAQMSSVYRVQDQTPQQAAPQQAQASPFANLPGQGGLASYEDLNDPMKRDAAMAQNANVWAQQFTKPGGGFDMQGYINAQHGYYDRTPNPGATAQGAGLAPLGLNSAINGFRSR